ncbi:uncharacterized protein LOC111711703 [Eurytemora carolleeae]|uniref:uncharacterized protein LOC111711703 n=1 Tax=Eurytemora carolleeae TaxID=1294199 RepID=UPI000C774397|nr:uncharacterized protein LOC111711703 [Eurytemora carolleeae]|eukprot:XP_023341881.1 uncharacterized protein LOC111711703 [Eurytemora affinis]
MSNDCPPVDGGWSTWGRWSQCSTTCGKGEQRRLRSCTAPMPSGEGRMCTGESFETNNCILRLCLTEGTLEPGTDLLRTNILGANRLFANFNNQNSKNRIFNKNQISLSRINQNKIRQNLEPTNMAESEDKMADRSAVQPIENLPEKNLICGNVPYIFGFGDPVVQSDGRIMYTCTQGRVLDTRTNRRRFIAECDRFGFLNMTLVPECRAATHCVGPVHRPGTNADIVSTVPQRDVEINTAIKYICSSGRDIFGTCFFDGRPRYPGYSDQLDQIMDQSMDQSEYLANNLKYNSSVCSIPETNKVENGGTETLLLEERMFGWLSLPDYPSFSSISSFTWFLTFPQHSFMVLGVEQIRNEDNTPEDWLELIYLDNQVLLNETHKRTSFFIYSNATIRLLESTKRRKFRLSYIMM